MQKLILALLMVVIFFSYTFAQDLKGFETLGNLSEIKKTPQLESPVPSIPLEHPVDDQQYIVGPGDILRIIIGNRLESTYNVKITPEGTLVIPTIGEINLSGMVLADAKKHILEKIKTKYLDDDVTITLSEIRSFKVTVSGSVVFPGLVIVNAMDRVSDAIFLSGGFIEEEGSLQETVPENKSTVRNPATERAKTDKVEESKSETEERPKTASKRNIIVKRRDGSMLRADFLKYQLCGDLETNPYLVDGDVIIVPTKVEKVGEIGIFGAVKTPDTFEFVPGDCVGGILDMAHGFTIDADSSRIELVRFVDNKSKTENIFLTLDTEENKQKTLNFLLNPDDRLFIQHIPQYHRKRLVEIKGEVLYPNNYPLSEEVKTLTDVIKQAGGFTPRASLNNAYVIRRSLKNVEDPELERLMYVEVRDMTQLEREYYKIKSTERTGKIAVDFIALFENNDKSQDVLLKDDDLIVIPAKGLTVNVTGQVVNPGLFQHKSGEKLNFYITEAGGYNWNARKNKVRIIKAKTGEWMKPRSTIIEQGDTIFVPENPEINWWVVARDFVTVAAQIATIYLVYERATEK
ncbi:SLBB domain-containing protein [candidate division KSB1 bacterium]|nr:SLBB domain-containing protein [candidate division KSB1 bacterium]